MRTYRKGWGWHTGRTRRPQRSAEGVIAAAIFAVIMGLFVATLLVALLALALAAAALAAFGYLSYRIARWLWAYYRRRSAEHRARHPAPELRGLLEMARTPDPLDRYLLAVREFDRLSTALLEVPPAELGRWRSGRRAAALAEQAEMLHEAVREIERELSAGPTVGGALAGVWELAIATDELWAYCRDLRNLRGPPSLAQVRRLESRRTALLARRDALVTRLRETDLRSGAGPPSSPPPSGAEATPEAAAVRPRTNQLGRRYQCARCATEVLCIRSGEGAVYCCGAPMALIQPAALFSSG